LAILNWQHLHVAKFDRTAKNEITEAKQISIENWW
jgi:hypothetical protein